MWRVLQRWSHWNVIKDEVVTRELEAFICDPVKVLNRLGTNDSESSSPSSSPSQHLADILVDEGSPLGEANGNSKNPLTNECHTDELGTPESDLPDVNEIRDIKKASTSSNSRRRLIKDESSDEEVSMWMGKIRRG